jgi:hypothetical protein
MFDAVVVLGQGSLSWTGTTNSHLLEKEVIPITKLIEGSGGFSRNQSL